ncbi:MAG: LD-carboxypeptidase [Clostridia bacterium]|nr:LD-carboxypeptidase [Clostridia bacterium]
MIYPKFLKAGDTIGICAPSAGIGLEKIEGFEKSLNNFKKEGYKIIETESVRFPYLPSNVANVRGEEFNNLLKDENIDMIWCAAGGDFMVEMLDFVDEKALIENPKWFAGYSDPTSLLFHITTNFDIATLYGNNAGSFDMTKLHSSLNNALSIIKGNIVKQESFEKCERERIEGLEGYNLDTDVYWKTPNGPVDIEGRLIGGCIDCLNNMIGTKYDGTAKFVEKYKEDGVIWYFDNFALKSEDLFYSLWHMKQSGWFKYAKGFVFGRTLFEGTTLDLSYEDAIQRALGEKIPIIMDADIGHVAPKFTVINGAIGHIKAENGKGELEMILK